MVTYPLPTTKNQFENCAKCKVNLHLRQRTRCQQQRNQYENCEKCKVVLHSQVTVDLQPEKLEEKEQVSNRKHAKCKVNLHLPHSVVICPIIEKNKTASQDKEIKQSAR
jgi:hypothetical protein